MITLHCSSPEEIKITLNVQLTLGEFRRIADIIKDIEGKFYSPLNDIRTAIVQGIREIEKREVIKQGESQ